MSLKKKIRKVCAVVLSATIMVSVSVSGVGIVQAVETAENSIIADFTPKAQKVIDQQTGIVHPGVALGSEDLDRIQKMVREGYEPWASAFDQFRSYAKSQKNYVIQNLDENGNPKFSIPGDSTGVGQYECRQDADAAAAQTLMWYITGDEDYLNNALKILRLWYTSVTAPTDDCLTGGMSVQKFCFAAEVLRYTDGSGWTEADTEGFTKFLEIMDPSLDRPDQWMNQGSIALMGYMSSAVFRNDSEDYDSAINRTTVNNEDGDPPYWDFSITNQLREVVINEETGETQIQLVEMGRDQGHAQGDLGALGALAQTAYIQGTKVYADGENVGNVTSDEDGVNIFQFLDNRLLKAANLNAQYNLGYDITYVPVQVGPEEIYSEVSSNGRGGTSAVFGLLYNYYHYVEGIPDDNPNMKHVKAMYDFITPEGDSQDFFGNGTLLYTPEEGKWDVPPKGEPGPLELPSYETIAEPFDRYQMANFAGGNIATESLTDSEGTRQVISQVKTNYFAYYQDYDFGPDPVDTMIIRASSSSSEGCKVDVILMDEVEGLDPAAITSEDLNRGKKIGTISVPATGWWNIYATVTGKLEQELSGKHSFALRFYGSDNVYSYQLNGDWMAFANSYANEKNIVAETASELLNGANVQDQTVTMTDGAGVLFENMHFDNGCGMLQVEAATENTGLLELREDNVEGELIASYELPNTNGEMQTIKRSPLENVALYGINDVCLIYKGEGELLLNSYQNVPMTATFARAEFERFTAVTQGDAVVKTEDDVTYSSVQADSDGTTMVFTGVDFGSGPLMASVRVRSNGIAHIAFVNENATDSKDDPPFMVIDIPDTNGEWKNVSFDMSNATKKLIGSNFLHVTVTGNATVDLDYLQFDPVESAPQIVPADTKKDISLYALADYQFEFQVVDIDSNPPVLGAQQLPEGASFDEATGMFTWQPKAEQAGVHQVYFTADDGQNVLVFKVNLTVYESFEALLDKATAAYDPNVQYTKESRYQYENAYQRVMWLKSLPNSTSQSILDAIAQLEEATQALKTIDIPQDAVDETGKLNVLNLADITASGPNWGGSPSQEEVGKLAFDGDVATAPDVTPGVSAWIILDFRAGLSVQLDSIRMIPRDHGTHYARMDGALIQGSNDMENWVDLIAPITGSQQGVWVEPEIITEGSYRYLRIINADSSKEWACNIAEIELYGQYGELISDPALGIVSISSSNENPSIAEAGDVVTFTFEANKELEKATVAVRGQEIDAVSQDGIHWTASYNVPEGESAGAFTFEIHFTDVDGKTGVALATTDGTFVLAVADKTDLTAVIDACETLEEEQYTAESWADFVEALANANAVLAKDDASQTEVDGALQNLQQAKAELVEKVQVDKSDLAAVIDEAQAIVAVIDQYVSSTVSGLADILEEAKVVFADANTTQDLVNAAVDKLSQALDKVQLKANNQKLLEAIEAGEKLDKSDYTADSYEALQNALEAGRKVAENEAATEAEMSQAAKAIADAMNGLIKAENEEKPNTSDSTQDSQTADDSQNSDSSHPDTPNTGTQTDYGFIFVMVILAIGSAGCLLGIKKKAKLM